MKRRSFLKLIGVGLAALVVSPMASFGEMGKTAPPVSAPQWNFMTSSYLTTERWSKHMWEMTEQERHFHEFMGDDNVIQAVH